MQVSPASVGPHLCRYIAPHPQQETPAVWLLFSVMTHPVAGPLYVVTSLPALDVSFCYAASIPVTMIESQLSALRM